MNIPTHLIQCEVSDPGFQGGIDRRQGFLQARRDLGNHLLRGFAVLAVELTRTERVKPEIAENGQQGKASGGLFDRL